MSKRHLVPARETSIGFVPSHVVVSQGKDVTLDKLRVTYFCNRAWKMLEELFDWTEISNWLHRDTTGISLTRYEAILSNGYTTDVVLKSVFFATDEEKGNAPALTKRPFLIRDSERIYWYIDGVALWAIGNRTTRDTKIMHSVGELEDVS